MVLCQWQSAIIYMGILAQLPSYLHITAGYKRLAYRWLIPAYRRLEYASRPALPAYRRLEYASRPALPLNNQKE
jgi:hypothetical protein